MFGLYDDAQMKFQKNFLAQHPVIMALFSNQGGKLMLFRPGKTPLEAPQVPIRYQLYKSLGHSSLAVFELVGPHLGTASDQSWAGPMRTFRASNKTALDSLDAVGLREDARENQRRVLSANMQQRQLCLRGHPAIRPGSETFPGAQCLAGRLDPGRALDEGGQGLEGDAWSGLGQDVWRQ